MKKFHYVAVRLSGDELFLDLDTISKNKKEAIRKAKEEHVINPSFCEKFPFVSIKTLKSFFALKYSVTKKARKKRIRKTKKEMSHVKSQD